MKVCSSLSIDDLILAVLVRESLEHLRKPVPADLRQESDAADREIRRRGIKPDVLSNLRTKLRSQAANEVGGLLMRSGDASMPWTVSL
jgi:hypothetical protein